MTVEKNTEEFSETWNYSGQNNVRSDRILQPFFGKIGSD
jgi:hypothetical protein